MEIDKTTSEQDFLSDHPELDGSEGFEERIEKIAAQKDKEYKSKIEQLEKEFPLQERIMALEQAKARESKLKIQEELAEFEAETVLLSQKERLERVKQTIKEGVTHGFKTGFSTMDSITYGLLPGQTYLFFADTGVGKSLFLINILLNLANSGHPVTYFDLENPSDFTTERLILVNEQITKKEWMELKEKKDYQKTDQLIDNLSLLPISYYSLDHLNDRFGQINFSSIETLIKEQITDGHRIFALDHIHYFEPSEKDHNKLGDIARQLNNLAANLNIVILFVCHSKKGLSFEKNGQVVTKRPVVDDINGSSLISKHTKNIIGLQRNVQSIDPLEQSKTYIYIDKTKSGPTGKFQALFDPATLTFEENPKPKETKNEPPF